MTDRPPPTDFASVQAHYDLNDDFFRLFLDESMTYTCARFDDPAVTLAEGQRAKIDNLLDKCDLRPGMRLLEVGCGWGAAAVRARRRHEVRVVALTLSRNQHEHNLRLAVGDDGLDFRLEGWETFTEPVDRILSIGAFEHFGRAKYPAFFARCYDLLPADGVLVLHLNTKGKPSRAIGFLRFVYWVRETWFPNADIPAPEAVLGLAREAGFEPLHFESLRLHYARTLDLWAAGLRARREVAVGLIGVDRYESFLRYLTGYAGYFRSGECNLCQYKFRKLG
jgi:cyclopropane-fatty-acyl-phospholipid synthase